MENRGSPTANHMDHAARELPRLTGMRVLVTGSAGHLGEALVRTLRRSGHDVVGLDLLDSPHTDAVGLGHRPPTWSAR